LITQRVRLLCFVLLLVALCLAALLPLSAQPEDPTATPYRWPTPGATPTPICGVAPPVRLTVRERARVTTAQDDPLNVRADAGTAYEVVGQIPRGGVFYVLEGPRCTQRYSWFRVEYGTLNGWIAEGITDEYFAEPYPPS
jgi:uncharacterized protein YgiM (DUF1202 family)